MYPFPTDYKGWGLKAYEVIEPGEFIMQYIGEMFKASSKEGI